MKNFIKTFAVLGLITLFSVSAQAQIKYGVKGGLNLSDIAQNLKDSDEEMDTKMRIGYHIGATVDYTINEKVSLQSGLLLTSKGFKVEDSESEAGFSADYKVSGIVNYLEIPVHFAYKINDFQIYAGPYLAFGVGGKFKTEYSLTFNGNTESDSDETKLKPVFGEVAEGDLEEDEGAYNAFDYGLNFGIGYQVGPVLLNAGYSLGLGNFVPKYENSDNEDKVSNRVISVSATYFFGK
ncbi:MAG: porin family protein [Bacteroidota bacterium]